MKTTFLILVLALSLSSHSQVAMKDYKIGYPFNISLPEYMARTTGLNSSASFEFKNVVKDVYGFVVIDDKETLKLAEMNFSSAREFYDDFIKDFIEGEEKVKQSTPVEKTIGAAKFVEADVSFYDKEAKTEIYYLIGIVETPKAFYKVISYCTLENKPKFKEDFKKILYSLRD